MSKTKTFACFQWIYEQREKMNAALEGMTPQERVAHSHREAEKALKGMRRMSPEQGREELHKILYGTSLKAKTGV